MSGARRRFRSWLLAWVAVAGSSLAPGLGSVALAAGPKTSVAATPFRDWRKAPAVAEVDHTGHLYAVSDTHGNYSGLSRLLSRNGLLARSGAGATDVKWTGGSAVLVVNGDMIDKGEGSVDLVDMLRHLQRTAPSSGGRVIVTFGNHEAEFLANPSGPKAMADRPGRRGLSAELIARGEDPALVAAGTDAAGRGQWLRELPFAARVQNWFFAHSGNTQGLTIAELGAKLEKSVDKHGFTGKRVAGPNSILQARRWYGSPLRDDKIKANAEALGVDHVAMGHEARVMHSAVSKIAASPDRTLVGIDTGMGEGRAGHLLHVDLAKPDNAESLDVHGRPERVF